MGRRITLLAVLLAACSSIEKLPPLDQIPDLKGLKDAYDALPNEAGHVVVDGVRLGYRLTKKGPENRTIVFVHGLLSDSRTWQFIAGSLGEDHRLMLIDLMGCGKSDKPDADDLPADAYSPDGLARQVLRMIREKTRGPVALVGHSLGGTVILRLLGNPKLREEFADVVDRVDRAVLMSAVDFAVERAHEVFEQVVDTPDFVATIASWVGLVEELTARAIFDGTQEPERMPREEAARMIDALSNGDTRQAAKVMIQRAVPFTEDRRPNWPRIEALVKDYGNIKPPTLVIWGARDETFSSAMGYKLAAQIPNAWLHVLPRRMHQLPSEGATECAKLVREFVAKGGEGRPRVVD